VEKYDFDRMSLRNGPIVFNIRRVGGGAGLRESLFLYSLISFHPNKIVNASAGCIFRDKITLEFAGIASITCKRPGGDS